MTARRGALLAALVAVALATPAAAAWDRERFDTTIAAAKAAMQLQPERAVALAADARRLADTSPPGERVIRQATADWLRGEGYSRLSRSDLARPLVERALRDVSASAPRATLVADMLLLHGNVSVDEGKVAVALGDFQRAYRIYALADDARGQAKALIELAFLHHEAHDPESAVKYYGRAAELQQIDPGLALSIHNGLGNELRDLGRFAGSKTEYDKAIALARQMESPILFATVIKNAALTALALGQRREAERLIAESVRVAGDIDSPGLRSQQVAILVGLALDQHQYARGAALLDRTFAGIDLTKTTIADREAHRVAVEAYRALGRSDLALAHFAAWKRLDDDATALARSYSAALVGARFDFANQEVRIARLKAAALQKSIAFERARGRTQQLIFVGTGTATAIIIALLAFFLFTVRRSRNQLAASNLALGKALAAKTEFLATTSHEIRTPLNGILGMTQVMLTDRSVTEPLRERVSIIHGAGLTMRALVDDILDVAKIENGSLAIEHEPFDLCTVIGEGCRIWEEQATAKGLSFAIDLSDCPQRIVGDAGRVRQVMFNLLANALKFTASGSISVATAQHGTQYRISVRDTGIGIPPDKHEAIFESFRQADTSTTRRFGGTGLGLAICRSLVRAMGGDVTVTSVPGEGSCFTVELPLTEAAASTHTDQPAPAASLLIVEANPIVRAMLKTMFAAAGETVALAESVAAATARIAAGPVAKILVDEATLAAGGDRAAALATLAGAATDSELFVTWPRADSDFNGLTRRGVDHPIAKPLAREALVAIVRRADATPLESQAA